MHIAQVTFFSPFPLRPSFSASAAILTLRHKSHIRASDCPAAPPTLFPPPFPASFSFFLSSAFDGGAVITNLSTNEKLGGLYTHPAVSICDPSYTFTVPTHQTAAGSADIMSHVFEGKQTSEFFHFSEQRSCDRIREQRTKRRLWI